MPTAPPTPAAPVGMAQWLAPPAWRSIDFISDLHLAADTPLTFEAWAAHLRHTSADAVVMLGDLFEVWIGDDVRHQPFESACLEVLEEVAPRLTLAFMAGNRDFLIGADWLHDAHTIRLQDPTLLEAFGQRIVLMHGDELCRSDTGYQRFRQFVRQPAWQAAFLAKPLAERQAMARQIRDASEQKKAEGGAEVWADLDADEMLQTLSASHATTLVHGHTHRPATDALAPGRVRHVLSDWDLDGHHGPARAEVLRLSAAGFERRSPDHAPGS